MKVAIGNDHAGTEYKLAIIGLLKSAQIDVINYGTDNADSVDYPDFAHKVAKDVQTGKVDFGILICGTGNGVCMTANKQQNVRAANCWTKEITQLTREHNDANVLCMPARYISLQQALEMTSVFINTSFAGGRHERRVIKIPIQ